MSGEKEFLFHEKRKCRGCGAAITVSREVWRGKERWMLYHAIPHCDWFRKVQEAKTAAAAAEEIQKGGRK